MRAILLLAVSASAFTPNPPDTLQLQAMRSELHRSMDSLKLRKNAGPYFLSYLLWDLQGWRVQASMGSVEQAEAEPTRMLDVDLRLGSYDRDQSRFEGGVVFGPRLRAPVAESGDTLLLRQALWTMTDARYKVALEQLAQKKSFLSAHHGSVEPPDWSRQKVLQQREIDPIRAPDSAAWTSLCKHLSAWLGSHAWLAESRVAYQYYYVTFYYVDSEGATYIQSLQEQTFLASLLCQAKDGSPLWEYLRLAARDSLSGGELRGETSFASLRDSLEKLTHRLDRLRMGPSTDLYRGPVLFTATAAGEVLNRALLQPQSRLREPLGENSEPSFLLSLLGRKYLPAGITVRDRPSRRRYGDKLLFGAYAFDHQGQPAEDVLLIDQGRISDFYRGKLPLREKDHRSNGHWRYGGGFPGVVEVEAGDGLPEKSLLDSLRRLSREEGAPFGLRISKLADEDAWKLLRHPLAQNLAFVGADMARGAFALPLPVTVDAVNTLTGEITPVRGLSLDALDSKSLRDIAAAGDTPYLLEPQASFSILCPSLLFSLLDLKGRSRIQPRLPLLP